MLNVLSKALPIRRSLEFSSKAMTSKQLSTSSYKDAITLLNSKQSGYKVLEERRRPGIKMDATNAMEQMRHWLRVIGYLPSDLDRLNIVRAAGTKGKDTTCAYINSILQRYQDTMQLPQKIGLYTSPYMMAVRERIRINSEPIPEEIFAKYFFEVWNALESASLEKQPNYFRFLTLLSFHVFMQEKVDTAIYETGVGGEMDSTNIIEKPLATAITTLGIDHVKTLGDTIDNIAWHKARIMKTGSIAFTTEQIPEAMAVLGERAAEKGTSLTKVIPQAALDNVALRPAEHFRKKNASLAIELARVVLAKFGINFNLANAKLPSQFIEGLEGLSWRGRCETKATGAQRWYIDCAHNETSLEIACRWFKGVSQSSSVVFIPMTLLVQQWSVKRLKTIRSARE